MVRYGDWECTLTRCSLVFRIDEKLTTSDRTGIVPQEDGLG